MAGPPTPNDDDPNLEFDVFAQRCPSREALQTVTGRWGTLALLALHDGPSRFNALRRRVDGVSEKMLAQTLQSLERDGLVLRVAEAVIPPRVEYSLTPTGQAVADRLMALIETLEGAMPEVMEARDAYDSRKAQPGRPAAHIS